jgi:hypothetical protein
MRELNMPRHIKLGTIFLVVLSTLGISYYYNLQRRIRELVEPQREARQPYLEAKPVFEERAPLRKVKLFFASSRQDGLLELEEREIHSSNQPALEAKQIVAELISGSNSERLPALPPETKLRELYVTRQGLAVVDITKEASQAHRGGLTQELASIYAVVNSLTQNIAGINEVQILIEGVEMETLAGHIDLTKPFREDLSMLAIEGRESASEESGSSENARSHPISTAAILPPP